MKKFLFSCLFLLFFSINSVEAYKIYSYDSDGNRVYTNYNGGFNTYDEDGNMTGRVRHFRNGKTIFYDNRGNILRKQIRTLNGSTYVYDNYGNKTGRIKTMASGRTNVYDANGNRIKTYVPKPNGRTYIYDNQGNKLGSIKQMPSGRYNYYNNPARPIPPGTTIRYGTSSLSNNGLNKHF